MTNNNSTGVIQYDGMCAFAVSTGKTNIKAGKHTATINGKTYLFSNRIAKLLFKLLPGRIKKADEAWNNKNN